MLELAGEEMDRADATRSEPLVRIAGICGPTAQAVAEAAMVRDLGYHAGLLSLEEGVHALTGRTAGFFGLTDRGVVEVGRVGDLCVFALDELELGEEERVWDVPYGTWRLRRKPAGFRATIVAGTPTWIDGAPTGARPGQVLAPG